MYDQNYYPFKQYYGPCMGVQNLSSILPVKSGRPEPRYNGPRRWCTVCRITQQTAHQKKPFQTPKIRLLKKSVLHQSHPGHCRFWCLQILWQVLWLNHVRILQWMLFESATRLKSICRLSLHQLRNDKPFSSHELLKYSNQIRLYNSYPSTSSNASYLSLSDTIHVNLLLR